MNETSKTHWFGLILCFLLFMMAFFVRAFAVDYGIFLGDERINTAAKVLAGDLVPEQHFYPPFIHYLNAVALAILFVVGQVIGWWDGTAGFRAQYFADPTAFYVAARLATAFTGALTAPLFYLAARTLHFDHLRSFCVALLVVFFPLAVAMAHIAKGDTGLATSIVALIVAMLYRVRHGPLMRSDLAIGLCVVLALSFKHSAVFVVFPLTLGLAAIVVHAEGLRTAARSIAKAMVVIVVLLPILNVGILLDLDGFLAYQEIQAVMSVQGDGQGALTGISTLFWRATEILFGMNPVMTVTALLTPVLLVAAKTSLPQKLTLAVIWVGLTIGTVAVALIVGPRQPEHLWIANFMGYLLLNGVVIADLTRTNVTVQRYATACLYLFSLAFGGYGTVEFLRQAYAQPMHLTVARYVAENYADRQILTSIVFERDQNIAAQQFEATRIDRLAQKYNVEMPSRAQENILKQPQPDALYFVNMPTAFFGLEGVKEDDVTYQVQPHAWPLQNEEWVLDYWTSAGFSLFVVKDFPVVLTEAKLEMQRDFYQSLQDQCQLQETFLPAKPLFLEREVWVFDCLS